MLGPGDGRFLVRSARDAAPERVLVLTTLGAPQRRLLRGRRGTVIREAEPEPVPTSRVTVISPEPFADRGSAAEWLERLRGEAEAHAEVATAVSVVNRALHSHRVARADPGVRDVGTGSGCASRTTVPRPRRSRRRSGAPSVVSTSTRSGAP